MTWTHEAPLEWGAFFRLGRTRIGNLPIVDEKNPWLGKTMTPSLQQFLPKDPRVEALPIRQDLHWEIQKYLRHPVADLVKTEDFRDRYDNIIYQARYSPRLYGKQLVRARAVFNEVETLAIGPGMEERWRVARDVMENAYNCYMMMEEEDWSDELVEYVANRVKELKRQLLA